MKLRRFRQFELAVCVCVLLCAGAADLLGQGAPPPQPMPSQRDRNNYLKAEFKLLDGDKDHRISAAEYEEHSKKAISKAAELAKKHGYREHMVSQLYTMNHGPEKHLAFSHFDDNDDGRIDFFDEYFGFPLRNFSDFCQWDGNGDSKVTKPEFLTSMRQQFKASFVEETPHPPTEKQQKHWALRFDLLDRSKDGNVTWLELRALIDLHPHPVFADGISYYVQDDGNFDGSVSREEFLARARKMADESFLRLKERVFPLRDLDGDGTLSVSEDARASENTARKFVSYDKDGDGVVLFEELKGIGWVAGKSIERDRGHFDRMDANQDRCVTWDELRTVNPRTTAFGAIDHVEIDNSISKKEWDAIEQEYLDAQKGKLQPNHPAWGYAVSWFRGIFDLVTFNDLDGNQDGLISWKEFKSFPN